MEAFIYTIVRFAPFSETGEFANIGIVLISQRANYFDFKIQRQKYARVTRFFREIEPRIYRAAVHNLGEELQRMKRSTNRNPKQLALAFEDMTVANLLLQELLRKREGVIRFDKVRMTVASNPKAELERLYGYYVDRNFVTPQYIEQVMEKEVRATLKYLNVSEQYTEARLSDGVYQARFPFVNLSNGVARHTIKPISLAQERPEAIIEHANKWAYALKRLRASGKIDGDVLFPVRPPEGGAKSRCDAFEEGKELLESEGGQVVIATGASELRKFLKV